MVFVIHWQILNMSYSNLAALNTKFRIQLICCQSNETFHTFDTSYSIFKTSEYNFQTFLNINFQHYWAENINLWYFIVQTSDFYNLIRCNIPMFYSENFPSYFSFSWGSQVFVIHFLSFEFPLFLKCHTWKHQNYTFQNCTEISVLASVFLNDIRVVVLTTYHHSPESVLSRGNFSFLQIWCSGLDRKNQRQSMISLFL